MYIYIYICVYIYIYICIYIIYIAIPSGLVMTNIAIENGHFRFSKVIFPSYVSLPEGIFIKSNNIISKASWTHGAKKWQQ